MSSTRIEGLGAVVLCGGESRRMGRDKASLLFGIETMLQRIVRQVSAVAWPVVVVAAAEQTVPSLPGDVILIRDPVPGRGPWQGISAGLHALSGRVDAAFVTSCDSPFLADGWIGRLFDLLDKHLCAVPEIDGHLQTLSAIYRLELLAEIDRLLSTEGAKPLSLFDRVTARRIHDHELRDIDPNLQTLCNINSPDDYSRALTAAGFA